MTVIPDTTREPAWTDVMVWFETIDAIVRGLGHSLNNRALALSATIESLDPKRPVGQQVASALTRESERLTEQLRQLRTLPFALEREPMPLLVRDVMASAIQLHRSHASLGEVPVYLEGSQDTPPVLAPESSLLHAALVTLSALKGFAAPNGVLRLNYGGTADLAQIELLAQRDPSDAHDDWTASALVKATTLSAALLGSAQLEIDMRVATDSTAVTWTLPSLKSMRRRARELATMG